MESCDRCELLYSGGPESGDHKRKMKEECEEALRQSGIGVQSMDLSGLVCIYRASEHGAIPLLTLTPRQAKTLARSIMLTVDELFSDAV